METDTEDIDVLGVFENVYITHLQVAIPQYSK